MKKLLIFGDSILKGIVYKPESGGYHTLKNERFERLKESGVEVHNYARMGGTVLRGMKDVKRYVTGDMSDTAIILGYGGNDCNFDWSNISDDPHGEHNPKVTEDEFVRDYVDCVDHCIDHGADVYLTTLVPLDSPKFMNWICKGNDRSSIMDFLGDISALRRWHEYYNNLVVGTALRTKSALIDVRKPFLLARDFDNLICADGIHPTEAGHSIIERTITGALLD